MVVYHILLYCPLQVVFEKNIEARILHIYFIRLHEIKYPPKQNMLMTVFPFMFTWEKLDISADAAIFISTIMCIAVYT